MIEVRTQADLDRALAKTNNGAGELIVCGRAECGGGLHFSPHPKMAREFNPSAMHFVASPVRVEDISVHPDGYMPQKVKAPKVCAPVYEVDLNGARLETDHA